MRKCGSTKHVVVAVLAFLNVGFKPITHIHSADRALSSQQQLTFFDKSYEKQADVHAAIMAYPDYYRAGVIGPDGFPDIMFGQGVVHPDTRCNNGRDTCGSGSFTHEWLSWVYDRGNSEYERLKGAGDIAAAQKVLAFTYGYLAHAAGDLWAHTLVNGYAKGTFPGIAEMIDPAVAKIAIRHIVVEGFIGSFTPTSINQQLNAPESFIRGTFIRDRDPWDEDDVCPNSRFKVPTTLANGSLFDTFLDNRDDLCKYRESLDTTIDGGEPLECLTGECLVDEAVNSAKHAYATAWIHDIDDGLTEWPSFSQRVAKELFQNDDFAAAVDKAKSFGLEYVLSMLGAPDFVGKGYLVIADLAARASDVASKIPGYDTVSGWIGKVKDGLLDFMCERAFGMSCTKWRDYMTNPHTYISDTAIGLSAAVPTELRTMMGATDGTYVPEQFVTLNNVRSLIALTLLAPKTLDSLLFDLHVGKLYTGTRIQTAISSEVVNEMQKNIMLGATRSIDANHTWSRRSPDYHANSNVSVSEGMPLWRDCLARERAFRKVFLNDTWLDVDKTLDDCLILADALPPVTFRVLAAEQTPPIAEGCFGANTHAIVINHKDVAQDYSVYYRVFETLPERKLVFHRVFNGTLAPMSSVTHDLAMSGECKDKLYEAEAFVFRKMTSFDVDDRSYNPLHWLQAPYFNAPINTPQKYQYRIKTSSADCPLANTTPPCGAVINNEPCVDTPEPPCRRQADGTLELKPLAKLDADDDTKPDTDDNCPTIANQDQTDTDANGLGDACDSPPAMRRLFQRPRQKNVFEDPKTWIALAQLQDAPPNPRSPVCLTCPESRAGMTAIIQRLALQTGSGKNASALLTRHLDAVLGETFAKGYGADIRKLIVDPSGHAMVLDVRAAQDATLVIGIAKPLLPQAWADVAVDAQPPVRIPAINGSVVVSVPKGASTIRVTLPEK